jgi:proline utilization trans-activator
MRQLPPLCEHRNKSVLDVEVMGLTELYLQIVDRKDDAYIYVSAPFSFRNMWRLLLSCYIQMNTALRLAITHGMHRANATQNLQRPEIVHRTRLWWKIYIQEGSSIQLSLAFTDDCRRLAAAGGDPLASGDSAIQVSPPSDFAGFPSATATGVNVRVARITG